MSHKPTLIIYGATSFTAKELLIYLDSHPQGGDFDFILAGRNRARLDSVNARLKREREVVVCELGDEEGVKALVGRGEVVLNFAGPFRWHNAEALIHACVEAGRHYVDLCGESAWLANIIVPKYHELAAKTGSCIVPSCGFDSIPTDLIVYQALRTLQAAYPNTGLKSSTSLFKFKGTIAGGTVQSMNSVAELPMKERRSGEYDLCPGEKHPSTAPSLSYSLPVPPPSFSVDTDTDTDTRTQPNPRGTKTFGSFFFMYPYNRCILRRSQYLSRAASSLPDSSDLAEHAASEPVHGDSMAYAEGLDVGLGRLGSALVSLGFFLFFGMFFSATWFRKLVGRWLPKPGEGATTEELYKGFVRITNRSVSHALPSGEVVEIWTEYKGSGDPGYLHTDYLLAESALSLVLPPPEGTALPPLAKQGGVLTPSTAMGQVLVERLRLSGKVQMKSVLEVVPSASASAAAGVGAGEARKDV